MVLPTPPTSDKSKAQTASDRRRLNTSEESSNSTGSIFIDTTSRYRVGAPAPLPALPLSTTFPARNHPIFLKFRAVRDQVEAILTKHDIIRGNLSLHLAYRHEERIPHNDKDLTLSIRMRRHDNWVSAVEDLTEFLRTNDLADLRIEFMDPRADRFVYDLTATPALRNAWKMLEPAILRLLGAGPAWESMQLVASGYDEKVAVPTVMIALTNEATVGYQNFLYGEIRDHLERYYDLGLDVAFIRAVGFFAAGESDMRLHGSDFTDVVPLGHSIGYSDGGSGTLGGYLQVDFPNGNRTERLWMGLTNHHVVRHSSTTQMEDIEGYEPDLDRREPQIQSPSSQDRIACVEELQKDLTVSELRLFGSGGVKEEAAQYGDELPGWMSAKLRYAENDYFTTRQTLQNVQKVNLNFGAIAASSGIGAKRQNRQQRFSEQLEKNVMAMDAMDWALLVVRPSRLGTNAFLDHLRLTLGNKNPDMGIPFAHAQVPLEGTKLFKKGRNGITAGRLQPFCVWTNTFTGQILWSPSIVGEDHGRFMRSGDSGCMILDGGGNLVGLGFAANENGVGSFVPIDQVYMDIERKVKGAKVISPPLARV